MTRIVDQNGQGVSRATLLAAMTDVTPSYQRRYLYGGKNMYKLKDQQGSITPDVRRSIAFRHNNQYSQEFIDRMYADVTDVGPQAPLEFYTLGVDVGVLGNPSFTASNGLNSFSGPEVFHLDNKETGQQADVTCQRVFRNRRWTAPIAPNPSLTDTYLFENCEFDVEGEAILVDIGESNPKPGGQMAPSVIFKNCQWFGNSTSSRCITGGYAWLENCYLHGTEDAWGGCFDSYAYMSSFIPTTDGLGDPHQDGIQMAGSGNFTMYQCCASGGEDPDSNAAVRLGTDFSAISNVRILHSLLDRGGYTLSLRGDSGGGHGISDLTVKGCRWTGTAPKGLAGFAAVDSVNVDLGSLVWEDNAYVDGTPIPSPV